MTEKDAQRLVDELSRKFGGHTEFEQVAPGRYRFAVLSPAFTGVAHLRRQDEAWKVVDEVLTREQILDLSLLLTLAPEDVEVAPQT